MTNVNAVIGSQYNDLLIGSDTNFSDLAGLGGNNTLVGSSDAMTNANYYEAPGAVTVNLDSVCHDGVAPGTAINGYGGTDTLIDISGIDGSQVSDIIYAGTISAENFNGNGGNDVVSYESFTGVIDVFFNSSVVVVPNPDLPDLNITDNLSNIQAVEINGSAFGLLEEDIIQGNSSAYVTTGQTLILGGTGSIYLTDENFSSVQNISDLKVGSSVDLFSLYAGSGTSLFNEGMGVNTIDLSGMGAGSSATVDLTNDSNAMTVIAGPGNDTLIGNGANVDNSTPNDTVIVLSDVGTYSFNGFRTIEMDYSLLQGENEPSIYFSPNYGSIDLIGTLPASTGVTIDDIAFTNMSHITDVLFTPSGSSYGEAGFYVTGSTAMFAAGVQTIDLSNGGLNVVNTVDLQNFGGNVTVVDGGGIDYLVAPSAFLGTLTVQQNYVTADNAFDVFIAHAGATNDISGFNVHDQILVSNIAIASGNFIETSAALTAGGDWTTSSSGGNTTLAIDTGSGNYTADLIGYSNALTSTNVAFNLTISSLDLAGTVSTGGGNDIFNWQLPSGSASGLTLNGGGGSNELVLLGTIASTMSFDLSNATNEMTAGNSAKVVGFGYIDASSLTTGSATLSLYAESTDLTTHTMIGGNGNQILEGGGGTNVLIADFGSDTLIGRGGSSSNVFVLYNYENSGTNSSAVNVQGFNALNDMIDLPASQFAAGLGSSAIIGQNVLTETNPYAYEGDVPAILVVGNGTNTASLYYNDGGGADDSYQLATVTGTNVGTHWGIKHLEHHISFSSAQGAVHHHA